MADLVYKYLTAEFQLDFNKCRDQSYDNAENMAGKCNDMQQKILEEKICKICFLGWPLLEFGRLRSY